MGVPAAEALRFDRNIVFDTHSVSPGPCGGGGRALGTSRSRAGGVDSKTLPDPSVPPQWRG